MRILGCSWTPHCDSLLEVSRKLCRAKLCSMGCIKKKALKCVKCATLAMWNGLQCLRRHRECADAMVLPSWRTSICNSEIVVIGSCLYVQWLQSSLQRNAVFLQYTWITLAVQLQHACRALRAPFQCAWSLSGAHQMHLSLCIFVAREQFSCSRCHCVRGFFALPVQQYCTSFDAQCSAYGVNLPNLCSTIALHHIEHLFGVRRLAVCLDHVLLCIWIAFHCAVSNQVPAPPGIVGAPCRMQAWILAGFDTSSSFSFYLY